MSPSSARPMETIAVVDHHARMLAFTAYALEVQGYTVLSTVDPHEAFSLARTVLDYRSAFTRPRP